MTGKTHEDSARQMERSMKLYLFPGYTRFRNDVVDAAQIVPGETILDFGCGVGLLEDFILPRLGMEGKVIGADIGRELIGIARERLMGKAGCEFCVIDSSGALPFESGTFDCIVTTLVFHLLTREQKDRVLGEFRRVLKPGGRLVMAEIGIPTGLYGKWIRFLTLRYWARVWPYVANSRASFEGRVPDEIREAGFKHVRMLKKMRGYIDLLRCSPAAEPD